MIAGRDIFSPWDEHTEIGLDSFSVGRWHRTVLKRVEEGDFDEDVDVQTEESGEGSVGGTEGEKETKAVKTKVNRWAKEKERREQKRRDRENLKGTNLSEEEKKQLTREERERWAAEKERRKGTEMEFKPENNKKKDIEKVDGKGGDAKIEGDEWLEMKRETLRKFGILAPQYDTEKPVRHLLGGKFQKEKPKSDL